MLFLVIKKPNIVNANCYGANLRLIVILYPLFLFPESLSSKDQESKDPQTCEEMGPAALLQWKSLIVVTGSPYRLF